MTGDLERARMSEMDAYIGLRGADNSAELSDVPDDRMKLYRSLWWNPVHSQTRVPAHQMGCFALADPRHGPNG